jgi:hypothetical protein
MELLKNKIGFTGVLTIKKYKEGKLIWQSEPIKNKVVSGAGGYGRNLIMRRLVGDATYGIQIDSAAIGDSATAPADSDTALGNSLVSGISISNSSLANNIATIDVFASDATLPDDTYAEFGFFIGGRLFSRILITPTYTKATGEDTIFSYTLTATG